MQNFSARATEKSEPVTNLELIEYCKSHSDTPENENDACVIISSIKSPKQFCVVWSTKKLLQAQLSSTLLQVNKIQLLFSYIYIKQITKKVDSTFSAVYNVRWQKNFPIQLAGYSDHNKRFQPTIIALSSSEDEFVYITIFEMD